MSVSTFTGAASHTVQFSKSNSGYPSTTTASPATNSFSLTSTSGSYYTKQQLITSGTTSSYDLVSGGLQDLVGNTANLSKLYSMEILPYSGAIQMETTQSGGMAIPQLGLSGGGVLVNPGAVLCIGESASGLNVALSAAKGNLVARAVSGDCLLSVGWYGL